VDRCGAARRRRPLTSASPVPGRAPRDARRAAWPSVTQAPTFRTS
jgi:hypothetical protein